MVAVLIIAVVFTGLAIGIAYSASKGGLKGLSNAVATESKGGKLALNTSLVFVYLAFGIAVPLIFILGNHANSNAKAAGVRLTANEQVGRELFAEHCAVCHTLAADNAIGKVGPNLDELRPSAALVLHTVTYGCLQNSTVPQTACLGYGTMDGDIVQGQQARDVAEFVAAVAGHT